MSKKDYVYCRYAEADMDGVHCTKGYSEGFGCDHFNLGSCVFYKPEKKNKQKEKNTKMVDGYQSKKSNIKQTPPNEGSSVASPSNINSEDGQNTVATSKSMTGQISSESVTINPPMSYGWICPKCGRVNAPWKDHCDCDGGKGLIWKFDDDNPHYKWHYELPIGPTKPYEWGDTPGWWNQGPTCEIKPKEGKFVYGIEYPDGHIEKCPSNYFAGLGDPIPCSPTAGDPNFGRSTTINTKINTQTGGDPNIKAYN